MGEAGELLADRYRLEHQLGSGAMGVVWLATDERLQRPVAVKQLIPQHGLDAARAEEARQRAMREGRIAGRLHHPNVVALHDVTEHDGLPVLVMEYVPSRSLGGVLTERGFLVPEAAASIGAQAATALAAAHEAGIVHRDVKPGNVLLGDDGTVKITDFGISHASGDVSVTQTGLLNGTPAYLAPEIARGHPPTPASDVFSLGATLYAAVEGRPPFGEHSENSLAVLHEAAAGNVPPPRHAGALATVLMSMMEREPSARLTPQQVREAMHAIASGHEAPTTIRQLGPDTRTQPLAPVSAATATAPQPRERNSGTRVDERPVAQWPAVNAGDPRRGVARHRKYFYLAAGLIAVLAAALFLIPTPESNTRGQSPSANAPADLERVVSDYYALLPEHPANAWTRLGPGLRSQGQEQHRNFWNSVTDVTVFSPPRASGDGTVHIGVELALPDGTRIRESHQLGMVVNRGTPLIDSDTVLRAETIAPPPPPPAHTEQSAEHEHEQSKSAEEGKGNEDKNGEQDKKGEEN